MKILILSLVTLFAVSAFAQENKSAASAKKNQDIRPRMTINLDYNSWFQQIDITGAQNYEADSLHYGLGVSIEYTQAKPSWGWSIFGGIITGNAATGADAASTTDYYSKVALNIIRTGFSIYYRINSRVSVGIAPTVLSGAVTWPDSNSLKAKSPTTVQTGAFLDTRWRLDSKWELIQSIGTYQKSPSVAWRVGTAYTF